ncbi:hypothetical protein K505DRAFT_345941 [Melanomma pulvis-pyrius CBS 109.77]|uniref:Aminotransferase class I/classII domain-containing protein n=1 Tax=Melanomma pulvis-pyrius CBS 109.77 TaxID=1314802 RepID=A0A6A6XSM1_9PLEO|nr:hypothetical protein K505DRAFT_345941 [Melanomma pulvis-pyrius CBS 109.77]
MKNRGTDLGGRSLPHALRYSMRKPWKAAARLHATKITKENLSVFYKRLDDAPDTRRKNYNLSPILYCIWQINNAVGFCSNDILALSASRALRAEFLDELSKNPIFSPGAEGSRVLDGHFPYLEQTEQHIGELQCRKWVRVLGSGFEANVAIWTAIPRLGDITVYDALSLAMAKKEFAHNDLKSFRSTLLSISDCRPVMKSRKRCVIVTLESVYSMDGEICSLQASSFVVDEAHSSGVIGEKGRGLISDLD